MFEIPWDEIRSIVENLLTLVILIVGVLTHRKVGKNGQS